MKKNGRHELKHYINYSDYLELKSKLPYIMKRDHNADQSGCYRIRSLYFDNYMDKALFEKINGVNEREKFRLRFYNNNCDFIRLEKKSKKNNLGYKESVQITKYECEQLLIGNYEPLRQNPSPLLLELYTKMFYQQLRPKNIVDYKREAFIMSAGNVRVTIDSDIRGSDNVFDFLAPDIITIPIPHTTILEVKYDAFLPEIVRGIVSLQNRQSTAFSKYGATRLI